MTRRPDHRVTDTESLLAFWHTLLGPGGFDLSSLWTILLDADGHVAPTIVPIDDLPEHPDGTLDGLRAVFAGTLTEQGLASVAFLLARPGPGVVLPGDRAWARALLALDDERLTRWPVHLATHGCVRVLAPDDLLRTA